MNYEPILQEIKTRTAQCMEGEEGLFLVDVKLKPVNQVKVFVDGDQGVNIDALTRVNRRLYKNLEENHLFPGDNFSLEVSSPGLEEPLKLHRQYVKNRGRSIQVTLADGRIMEGKLTGVSEDSIELEQRIKQSGSGKKPAETITRTIPFSEIKETIVQATF
jgi:ribosome maturation factor RimP